MADFEVVGDDLCVTHGRTTTRLSLRLPMLALAAYLDVDNGPAIPTYERVRDTVMPDEARAYVTALEATDAVLAIEVQTRWAQALGERLGKALSPGPSGASTEPPSPPTSGSDGESVPETPSRSPRSRRTPKRS